MKLKPPFVAMALLICSTLIASVCQAHAVNLSSSTISITGETIHIEWRMSKSDAARIEAAPIETDSTEKGIGGYLLSRSLVTSGATNAPCKGRFVGAQESQDQLVIQLSWHCQPSMENIRYRVSLFAESDPGARHIVLIPGDEGTRQAVLTADNPQVLLPRHPGTSLLSTAKSYVVLGIEHIFIGYDHIAFLIVIMLWASRLLPVVSAVTAFTVAHSITLALAAMNIIVVPSLFVEPLIALSIVYGAAQNLISRDMAGRWRTTAVLGLIHGFGFAGVLREVGLPDDALVTALASFNLGIEAGQIVIASLVFMALKSLDRVTSDGVMARSVTVVTASLILGGVGIYWFAERLATL